MVNQVTLIGRLGNDTETTASYTRMSVATSSRWQNKKTGEWEERTSWHRVTLFAEKFLPKGALVYVDGSIQYTEKDGKHYTSIIANRVRRLDKPATSEQQAEPMPMYEGAKGADDDLPF